METYTIQDGYLRVNISGDTILNFGSPVALQITNLKHRLFKMWPEFETQVMSPKVKKILIKSDLWFESWSSELRSPLLSSMLLFLMPCTKWTDWSQGFLHLQRHYSMKKTLSSKKNMLIWQAPVTVMVRNAHIPGKLSITKKDWYLQWNYFKVPENIILFKM